MPDRFAPFNSDNKAVLQNRLSRLTQERGEISTLLSRIEQAIPEAERLSGSGIFFTETQAKRKKLQEITLTLKRGRKIFKSAIIQIDLFLEFEQIGTKTRIKSPEKFQKTLFEQELPIIHWN